MIHPSKIYENLASYMLLTKSLHGFGWFICIADSKWVSHMVGAVPGAGVQHWVDRIPFPTCWRGETVDLAFCHRCGLGKGGKATVAVDNSFQKYLLWNEERRVDGSWSWGKEGFSFVFNMGDARAYLYGAERLPERQKVNVQKRKEVPAGSGPWRWEWVACISPVEC